MNIRHAANNAGCCFQHHKFIVCAGCCFQHHKFIVPGMRDQHSSAVRPRCLESQGPGRIVAEIPCIPEPISTVELPHAICCLPSSTGLGVERLQRGAPRVHLLPSFECSRISKKMPGSAKVACGSRDAWGCREPWLVVVQQDVGSKKRYNKLYHAIIIRLGDALYPIEALSKPPRHDVHRKCLKYLGTHIKIQWAMPPFSTAVYLACWYPIGIFLFSLHPHVSLHELH